MVQSITLNVEGKKIDLKSIIIEEFGEMVDYNSLEGNNSIDNGYTFKDQSIVMKMIDEIIPVEKINERLDDTCKCDFCTKMQTSGNLMRMMFGFCIEGNTIRRNIWLANWMTFIYYERIQLLYHFLLQVQERLKKRGIESTIDLSDVDDRALEDYKKRK